MALTFSDRRLLVDLGIIFTLKVLFIFCIKSVFFDHEEDASIKTDIHFFKDNTAYIQEHKPIKQSATLANKKLNKTQKEL